MSAHVEHDFEKGFILDEVRIRKLHEIVEVRVRKLPSEPKLLLKVYRGDSLSYETEDVGVVVGEDNDDWRTVTRIDFLAGIEDVFLFRLSFSPRRVSLFITGDDRDAVFLLFSDIRDYLTNEVLSGYPVSRDVSRLVGLMIMFFATTGFFWSMLSSIEPDRDAVAAAIASDDAITKLNFILEERANRSIGMLPYGWLAAMIVAMMVSVGGMFESVWRFAFPTNLFLFGRRKQTFERRQSLKNKVFWGVFVAFAVSIVASLVFARWQQ